ncbi:hypothetical protein C8Q80DRAFT_1120509 [Daedaleopsis nitida]|nr:hypothetical protein C8Q80DRAFT_1120509 [Daedaleopsis nitida]
MAPTLAFLRPSSTHLLDTLAPPPPSQEFAMQHVPNVFVIPPEEEQDYNPPWCYFDATKAAEDGFSTHPDIDALNVALSLCQQTDNRSPAFHRSFTNESQETIVMPHRSSVLRLRNVDMNQEEDGQTDIRTRGTNRKYDEEIVEVVKVRRNESDGGDGWKMKKSNTFRARASQALRSIKLNVGGGRGHRRASVSAPTQPQPNEPQPSTRTLPTRHYCQEELPASGPSSPSVSRRRSLTFSQLFTTFKENQGGSRPATPSDELMSPTSPTLVASDSTPSTRPMSPTESVSSPTGCTQPLPPPEDCAATPSKAATLSPQPLEAEGSSKPTLSKRKSFRRRLSVLELQKIFTLGGSGSTASSPSEPIPPQTQFEDDADVFSHSSSRPKSMDVTSVLSSTSRASVSSTGTDLTARPSMSSHTSDTIRETDELEMRLDSLHFDSLHIDPDELFSSL